MLNDENKYGRKENKGVISAGRMQMVSLPHISIGTRLEYNVTRLVDGVTLRGKSITTILPDPVATKRSGRFVLRDVITIGGEVIEYSFLMSQASDGTLYCHGNSGQGSGRLVVNHRGGFYVYLRSPFIVGDHYSTNVTYDNNTSMRWQCSVEAVEQVKVPIGKMMAFRIVMSKQEDHRPLYGYTAWYSPEYGYPIKNVRSFGKQVYISELVRVTTEETLPEI